MMFTRDASHGGCILKAGFPPSISDSLVETGLPAVDPQKKYAEGRLLVITEQHSLPLAAHRWLRIKETLSNGSLTPHASRGRAVFSWILFLSPFTNTRSWPPGGSQLVELHKDPRLFIPLFKDKILNFTFLSHPTSSGVSSLCQSYL